jgi:hypothetical protein
MLAVVRATLCPPHQLIPHLVTERSATLAPIQLYDRFISPHMPADEQSVARDVLSPLKSLHLHFSSSLSLRTTRRPRHGQTTHGAAAASVWRTRCACALSPSIVGEVQGPGGAGLPVSLRRASRGTPARRTGDRRTLRDRGVVVRSWSPFCLTSAFCLLFPTVFLRCGGRPLAPPPRVRGEARTRRLCGVARRPRAWSFARAPCCDADQEPSEREMRVRG